MNRKKQTILELGILAVLIFVYLRLNSYYLSGEALLHANEIGLHYGPSEEIVLEHRNGTNVLMAGWIDNRNLSVIQGKKYGPLYKLRGGGITGQLYITEGQSAVSYLSRDDNFLLGLVDKKMHPECTRVVCYFEKKSNDTEGEEFFIEAEVQENGVFFRDDPGIEPPGEDFWYNVLNVEGYDAKGNMLFKNY